MSFGLPIRLTEKAAELERRGLRVTRVRPASEPLHLGRLAGNHFDLVVRHLQTHTGGPGGDQRGVPAAVERAVENIKVCTSKRPLSIITISLILLNYIRDRTKYLLAWSPNNQSKLW